jgi:CheY-like chemotaxis protein
MVVNKPPDSLTILRRFSCILISAAIYSGIPREYLTVQRIAKRKTHMDDLHVLVVEDLTDTANSMALLLELWGYKPTLVYDGKKAMEIAPTLCPDVVFLDIGLPGISGYEIARQLRQSPATASALIVAITGYGRAEDIRCCKEAGIDLHILKPAGPEELKTLLETRGRYLLGCSG